VRSLDSTLKLEPIMDLFPDSQSNWRTAFFFASFHLRIGKEVDFLSFAMRLAGLQRFPEVMFLRIASRRLFGPGRFPAGWWSTAPDAASAASFRESFLPSPQNLCISRVVTSQIPPVRAGSKSARSRN